MIAAVNGNLRRQRRYFARCCSQPDKNILKRKCCTASGGWYGPGLAGRRQQGCDLEIGGGATFEAGVQHRTAPRAWFGFFSSPLEIEISRTDRAKNAHLSALAAKIAMINLSQDQPAAIARFGGDPRDRVMIGRGNQIGSRGRMANFVSQPHRGWSIPVAFIAGFVVVIAGGFLSMAYLALDDSTLAKPSFRIRCRLWMEKNHRYFPK
jgi:hypothetical protein